MYTTVFFDMDGLMYNSERIYLETWKEASRISGIPMSEALLMRIPGSSKKTITGYFLEAYGGRWSECLEVLRQARAPLMERVLDSDIPLKKGLMRLLEYLAEHRYRIGVATSSTRETTVKRLARSGLTGYFTHIICGTDVSKHKPDPEIYLTLMERFQAKQEECIILEDFLHGLQAGKAAGCDVVFVPDLVRRFEGEELFYRYKVSSLEEVIPILQAETANV